MADILDLYTALEQDERLQRNWERNQPGIDRALESPLIARTPREVATAALLVIKLRFEEAVQSFVDVTADAGLVTFARTQGTGGARLANIIEGKKDADLIAKAAAIHSLRFYQDRSADNPLVRLQWTVDGLKRVSAADAGTLINPALKPTWAARKAESVKSLASVLIETCTGEVPNLRERLRSLPGLGPERADAVGVFAFRAGWPIVDEYLWRLMARHGLLQPSQENIKDYDKRRTAFDPHWQRLLAARTNDPTEVAATLYLWADEAERFGFSYSV